MLDKVLTGQSIAISVLGGSGIPVFFPSFHTHPKLNIRMTPLQCQCAAVQGTTPISPTCYPLWKKETSTEGTGYRSSTLKRRGKGKNLRIRTKERQKGYLASLNMGTCKQGVQIRDHERMRSVDYMHSHNSSGGRLGLSRESSKEIVEGELCGRRRDYVDLIL